MAGLDALERAMPVNETHAFLNYAGTAPLSRPAAEAMRATIAEGLAPMSEHFDAWFEELERARGIVARAIGATPDEIAFTTNTSTALSVAAAMVPWRPGDRVIYPADEFPSNRYVWQNLALFGVEAEAVPVTEAPFHELLEARGLEGVRVVALSEVSYLDGRRHDVAAVTRLAHAAGALVVVDAIQAVGAVPVDIGRSGADLLACGGQKWLLGPTGSGFLYVRGDRLEDLHTPLVGWASSRHAPELTRGDLVLASGARRLEPGLPDVAAVRGLAASIALLEEAGWSRVHARVRAHRQRLVEGLEEAGLEPDPRAREAEHGGIVRVPLADAAQVAADLGKARIVVTERDGALRISAHATTPDEAVERLLERLGASPARRPAPVPQGTPSAPREVGDWRHATLTGATGGLGRALAHALAARGISLALVGRDARRLAALGQELADTHGAVVTTHVLDLADAPVVHAFAADPDGPLAATDLLVLAAVDAHAGAFLAEDPTRLAAGFQANVVSPMVLARAALGPMLGRGHGQLATVVTTGARAAMPAFSVYAATKGALWSWTEALGREFAGTGVIASVVLPPPMDTTTRNHLGRGALAYYDSPDRGRATREPEEVARWALDGLAVGRDRVIAPRARWELALNALAPALVSRRIARSYRGLGPREGS